MLSHSAHARSCTGLRRSWFDTGSCVRTPPVVNILYMKNRLQTQNRLQNRVDNPQNFLAARRRLDCPVSFHRLKNFSYYFFQDLERKEMFRFLIVITWLQNSTRSLPQSRANNVSWEIVSISLAVPHQSILLHFLIWFVAKPPFYLSLFQRKNEKHSPNDFHLLSAHRFRKRRWIYRIARNAC